MASAVSFDTEKLDEETLASRTANVQRILHPEAAGAATPPATPASSPAAESEPRRQRMTVGKLAERYQKRIAENTENIAKMESIVATYQQKIGEHKASLAVWQEALNEINAD